MRRRRVLQMGAAVATLPLAGCGAGAPEGKISPVATGSSNGAGPAVRASARAVDPAGTATTAAPSPTGNEPTAEAPARDTPPDPPPAREPSYSRVIARVGKNHGHELTVTLADVKAGVEKTYPIAGTAGHPHTVTLSADHMKTLLGGQLVRTQSSKGFHAHRVTVRCAPAVDPPEWVSVCHAEFSGKDEHEIVIPAADMATRADRKYDVQGLAGHTHEVALTAADFQKLAKGEAVSVQTTRDETDAHLHTVFVQYRAPAKG